MLRDSDFFRPSNLWKDKALRVSLALCLAVLMVGSGALFAYLAKQTIFVDKIAEVTIVSKETAEKLGAPAGPISAIAVIAAQDSPAVLTGYAANVVDVCKRRPLPNGQVILLTKARDGFVAVTANLDVKVCSLFLSKEGGGANTVWAVADSAFEGIDSKPAYVMLNNSDQGLFRLRR